MDASCTSNLDIVNLITWLLVVVGWILVNWQNNIREGRKELYSRVTKIIQLIEKTEKDAITFHTSKDYNAELNAEVFRSINKIVHALENLPFDPKIQATQFRQGITANNFEEDEFTQSEPLSSISLKIMSSAENINGLLIKGFESKYKG